MLSAMYVIGPPLGRTTMVVLVTGVPTWVPVVWRTKRASVRRARRARCSSWAVRARLEAMEMKKMGMGMEMLEKSRKEEWRITRLMEGEDGFYSTLIQVNT
jgi:hypothetical protein